MGTIFVDFTVFTMNEPNLPTAANAKDTGSSEDQPGPSEQIVTDVDLRSTGRDMTDDIIPDKITSANDDELNPDDIVFPGGAILSCSKYQKVKMMK